MERKTWLELKKTKREWKDIQQTWNEECEQVIQRSKGDFPDRNIFELQTFVDASEKAYAVVVYFKIQQNKKYKIWLIFNKNRLCSFKGMTISRLKLLAL